MAYSQLQKMETKVHIKAFTEKFYDIFCNRTYLVAKIFPECVQSVEIHEGEWGTEKSIICWTYIHEGKTCVGKEIVEGIDRENKKMSFRVMEGDVLEHFKSFRLMMQVSPKEKENGSVVHWVVEFEKQKPQIPDPHALLQLVVEESKKVDDYLTKNQNQINVSLFSNKN